MHNVTESDIFPATIGAIDDTDLPNAANINTSINALTDRTRYLFNRLGGFHNSSVHSRQQFDGVAGNSPPTAIQTWTTTAYSGTPYLVFQSPASPVVIVGDVLDFKLSCNLTTGDDGTGNQIVRVKLMISGDGGSTFTDLNGTQLYLTTNKDDGGSYAWSPGGQFDLSAFAGDRYSIYMIGEVGATTHTPNITLVGSFSYQDTLYHTN